MNFIFASIQILFTLSSVSFGSLDSKQSSKILKCSQTFLIKSSRFERDSFEILVYTNQQFEGDVSVAISKHPRTGQWIEQNTILQRVQRAKVFQIDKKLLAENKPIPIIGGARVPEDFHGRSAVDRAYLNSRKFSKSRMDFILEQDWLFTGANFVQVNVIRGTLDNQNGYEYVGNLGFYEVNSFSEKLPLQFSLERRGLSLDLKSIIGSEPKKIIEIKRAFAIGNTSEERKLVRSIWEQVFLSFLKSYDLSNTYILAHTDRPGKIIFSQYYSSNNYGIKEVAKYKTADGMEYILLIRADELAKILSNSVKSVGFEALSLPPSSDQ